MATLYIFTVLSFFFSSFAASAPGAVSLVQIRAGTSFRNEACNLFPPLSSWFLDEGAAILSPNYAKAATSAAVPMFPDFDGDFKLEYFYSNHAGSHTPTPNEGMVFGRIRGSNFSKVNVTLTRTDQLPVKGRSAVDMHGSAIVDLDRDGYLDMFVVTGGKNGNADSLGYASLLYWGSEPTGPSMWHAEGGIYAAMDAGLVNDNGENRGRSTYIADFNNDGLLDILIHNLERDKHIPSRIFYNNGNRTFTVDPSFEEYIDNTIVIGTSLLIQRDSCMTKPASSYSLFRVQFCSVKPAHSWVNYSFDKSLGHMVSREIEGFPNRMFKNIQAAWIDDDDEPDFFMSSCTPYFLYSTGQHEEIVIPPGFDCETSTMQDFNGDGELEILSIYSQRMSNEFRAVLYTRDPNARAPPFWVVQDYALDWPKRWNNRTGGIEDIASVDYNNDGLMDITFEDDAVYHLTNTLWSHGQSSSGCKKSRYLAVVLEGKTFNQYGIGSTILLEASKMGPHRNETRSLRRAISSYSHGTSKKGGASDHRTVFGLGTDGLPMRLEVTWPGGEKSKIHDEGVLLGHLNDITNPLIVKL